MAKRFAQTFGFNEYALDQAVTGWGIADPEQVVALVNGCSTVVNAKKSPSQEVTVAQLAEAIDLSEEQVARLHAVLGKIGKKLTIAPDSARNPLL